MARALASGSAKTARLALGRPSSLLVQSRLRAPSSTWPTSLTRTLRPSAVGAEDDVLELLRLGQPAEGGDGELERLAGCGRRLLAEVAGRHLHVLLADGVGHVAGGQVQRRQPLGVDPEAHAVVLLAELEHVADAVHAGELVLDLDGGVVAEVELVVAAVGRVDADDHAGCPGCACAW